MIQIKRKITDLKHDVPITKYAFNQLLIFIYFLSYLLSIIFFPHKVFT